MNTPEVTIVMTPRDRFSHTQDAIEAVYGLADIPFRFIFVDGGFPAPIRRYLEKKQKETGFQYIKIDHFLAPNHAKNLAMPFVSGKYTVFIDNDGVPLNKGWLGALVRCAEETGAAMVTPLICEGWPEAHLVHFATGFNHIEENVVEGKKVRSLVMTIDRQHDKVADALKTYKRSETELTEMHAMMVRNDVLFKLGGFDPNILGSRDHVDFCLEVTSGGGKIFFEPTSQVRFLPAAPLGPRLQSMDIPYYALRWCDEWWDGSLDYLQKKWDVVDSGYFADRYKITGWRRKSLISRRIARRLTLGLNIPFIESLVDARVKNWSSAMAKRYTQQAQELGDRIQRHPR